jgi:hypothetical protein
MKGCTVQFTRVHCHHYEVYPQVGVRRNDLRRRGGGGGREGANDKYIK